MVDKNKRLFVGSGLATLATAFLPKAANAQSRNSVKDFYLAVAKDAYEQVFAGKLGNIRSVAQLDALWEQNKEAYEEALHNSMLKRIRGEDAETLDALDYARTLAKHARNDMTMLTNGRRPQANANPLFLAVKDIAGIAGSKMVAEMEGVFGKLSKTTADFAKDLQNGKAIPAPTAGLIHT